MVDDVIFKNFEEYKLAADFASFILLLSTLFIKYNPSPPLTPPNKDDAMLVSART